MRGRALGSLNGAFWGRVKCWWLNVGFGPASGAEFQTAVNSRDRDGRARSNATRRSVLRRSPACFGVSEGPTPRTRGAGDDVPALPIPARARLVHPQQWFITVAGAEPLEQPVHFLGRVGDIPVMPRRTPTTMTRPRSVRTGRLERLPTLAQAEGY